MICQDTEILLNMQIDGMLSSAQQEELLLHLRECPYCAAMAKEYGDLERLLIQEMVNVPVPPAFTDQVMSRITAKPVALPGNVHKRTLRKGWHWLGGAAIAAALVFGAMVGGFFDRNQPFSENETPDITAEVKPTHRIQDFLDNLEQNDSKDEQNKKEDITSTEEKQTTDPVENTETVVPPATYGNGIPLPQVAYGSESQGAYALTTLAAIDQRDALLPRVNGDTVTFYVKDNQANLEYQVNISAGTEPVFMGETESLPSPAGLGKAVDNGYQAAAADGALANNQADGLWITNNGEEAYLATTSGGGSLLSWASDSNKVFFTTASGALCLYYRAENICLTIHEAAVTSASWSSDCKTIVFSSTGDNGYSCIFKVTVP